MELLALNAALAETEELEHAAMSREQMTLFGTTSVGWSNPAAIATKTWTCGFCSTYVASDRGYYTLTGRGIIAICPRCAGPTFFDYSGNQVPGVAPGRDITHVPDDLARLYREARQSTAVGAYTAAVLVCRKMLLHIAADRGAPPADLKNFVAAIDFLAQKGFVPPDGKDWVDHIRTRGNEATHEIVLMTAQDAIDLITFVEMLLRFIYEFPSMIPKSQARPKS